MKAASSAAILEAAAQVFAEQGFHSATTAAVAERAGVSKGLIFNHFKTKDELLKALVEHRLAEQLTFWRNLELKGTPHAQLRQVLDCALAAVVDAPEAHRLYFSLMFQPGGAGAVQAAVDTLKPAIMEYYALLERLFREAGSSSPRVDSLAFQFALNGLAQTIVAQPDVIRKPKVFPLDALKARIIAAFVPRAKVKKVSR
jgi:AcrR family transcriptional regulator